MFTSWLILLLGYLVLILWIAFNDKFRKICDAESLIHEYRRNREKFLEWKERLENGQE